MPEETTYGFNRDDATAMVQGISHSEGWYPEIRPRAANSGTSINGTCACTCIEDGDIEVQSIITSSVWMVAMSNVRFVQTNGTITFPAGTYTLTWNSGTSIWELDIGSYLTAAYNDDSDATGDTTMDGTLEMSWTGGVAEINLCVDGTIPAP